MRRDLTDLFLQVVERRDGWRDGGFENLIKTIQENPKWTLNWDKSVPEYWVGIEANEKAIAVIRVDFPLVIVLKQAHEEISKIFSNEAIKYLVVDDFKDSSFSLEKDKIGEIFPDKFSDVIDSANFSIQQLVYSTI